MSSSTQQKAKDASSQGNSTMAWLFSMSIFIATANTLLYKAALNAFSSPTTNYGFFASQFSILLYVFQALIFSIFVVARDFNSIKELFRIPQKVYLCMGFLDSASGTLGAIAGAYCPGEVQTVLNQLIIPITMVGAAGFLNAKFESFQIWGSIFILSGAIVASSGYFFTSTEDSAAGLNITDSSSSDSGDNSTTTSVAKVTSAMVSAAVFLYFLSVIPSALSNIYKEGKMKEQDMNEVHTSTVVAFWQLWFGFLFLPLMSLPALGGLTYTEMGSQLSDGWTCFLGTNPNDPQGDCSRAAWLLMAYIVVNFFYNILMLAITKRGSAVLLVISQALSLPVTNIAFTLKIFMGEAAEPLTVVDLLGLVLVCIGFLTYSGFGLASNFMVAQGPPGQMAYVHFEDMSEVLVSTEIALRPDQLVDFLLRATLQQQTVRQHHQEHQAYRARAHSADSVISVSSVSAAGRESAALCASTSPGGRGVYDSIGSADVLGAEMAERGGVHSTEGQGVVVPTQLSAGREALAVARQAVRLLEEQVQQLETEHSSTHTRPAPITTVAPYADKRPVKSIPSSISPRNQGSHSFSAQVSHTKDVEMQPLLK